MDVRVPLHRSEELVIETLGDELLVYDKTNQRAHCLSTDAARVWHACDGNTDAGTMSAQLDLPLDVVRRAVDELESSGLLDQGFELVDSGSENGNGKAFTRREFAVRSATVGTAAAAAPLILSLAVPSAAMAASPTFGQCAVYSSGSCGNNPGQCGFYEGCCCCCDYQGQSSCKACTSLSTCLPAVSGNTCNPALGPGDLGSRANCASGNTGVNPITAQGCCGPQGNPATTNCGCLYTTNGLIATTGAGGPGGGAGCCDTSSPVGATGPPFNTCNPGVNGTCVPCCNGFPIATTSRLGCCSNTTDIGTCVAAP